MGWKIKEPCTIYAIRCVQNGKIYVGRTQNFERRMREHLYELKKGYKDIGRKKVHGFQADFDKYGEQEFEVYILEENVPPHAALERERAWIEEYNSTDPHFGYNKCSEKPARGLNCIKPGLPPKKEAIQ